MKAIKNSPVEYSILILLEEPSEGFADFINRIHQTFTQHTDSFEIVILANGSEAFLHSQFAFISPFLQNIRAYRFNYKTTQAVCLKAGLKESQGQKIMACGSYQQITEESYLRLINSLTDDVDIVCPFRQGRVDPKINQLQSKLFNWFVKFLFDTQLNDLNSNVRVFHRNVLEDINLYGNMYRFFPILAEQNGLKTREVNCDHYEERGKTGLYQLSEYVVRIIDILTIYFNTKFVRKPLRFFMGFGAVFIGISLLLGGYITFLKIFFEYPIGDNPLLLLSVFLLSIGGQSTGIGLLGEIISFNIGRKKNEYQITQTINIVPEQQAETGLDNRL